VAASVLDGAVRILALDGTARAVVPDAHQRRNVRGVAFSPLGDLIASAGWDSTVRLWNLDGSPHGQPVQAHYDSAFSVSFSSQGDRLATAGLDNRVRFWTLAGLSAGDLPEPRKDRVSTVALAPQAPIVAVADDTGTIRMWNLDGTMRGKPMTGHKGLIASLAFSPRGDQLASGGADRTFRLWNLDGSPRGTFPPHGDQVAMVAFAPSGDLVLSGSEQLRGWRANRLAFASPLGGWDFITAAAFTPKGDAIVTGTRLGRIQVLNADGSARTEPLKLTREYVRAVAISPDGQIFATAGGEENQVRLWNADLTPLGSPLTGHFGAVRAIAFSPNSNVLVSGGDDGTVRLWKLPSREAEVLLVGVPINQVGFWNDLLWARADGESIFFFDRTRKLAATTLLRRDAILTFTPDGWYAGPQRAERALRAFRLSGERLDDAAILKRASPERVRRALSQ
jgi:WD40 repeat protein